MAIVAAENNALFFQANLQVDLSAKIYLSSYTSCIGYLTARESAVVGGLPCTRPCLRYLPFSVCIRADADRAIGSTLQRRLLETTD